MFCAADPPFHGVNDGDTMENVINGTFEFPVEEWEHISPAAINFVRALLRVDPMLRMTADEALEVMRMADRAAKLQRKHASLALAYSTNGWFRW